MRRGFWEPLAVPGVPLEVLRGSFAAVPFGSLWGSLQVPLRILWILVKKQKEGGGDIFFLKKRDFRF